MKRIVLGVSAAALLGACAAGKAEEKKGAAPVAKEERERLQNVGYFDVGTCTAKPPKLPEKVTSEVLLGELIAAQPLVMECLVDPKNRGPEADTRVTVDQALTDSGVKTTVGGTNVSPEGSACITQALDKWTGQSPSLKAKNAVTTKGEKGQGPQQPTGHFEVQHRVGVSPSVKMGNNWASDVVGKIRLAEPTWCDCFEGEAVPASLKAKAKFTKPAGAETEVAPASITFEPTTDAAATKMASCLQAKVMGLKFAPPPSEFELPINFSFINSESQKPLGADAVPQVAFSQFDAMRGKKSADAAIAVGAMTVSRSEYGDAVDKFKKTPPDKSWKMVPALKTKCKEMLKVDEGFANALQAQLSVEQQTHEFAAALKAKDPMWADTEAASGQQAQQTEQQLSAAKQQRKSDEGLCPKESYK